MVKYGIYFYNIVKSIVTSFFNSFLYKSNKCLLRNTGIKAIANWLDLNVVIVSGCRGKCVSLYMVLEISTSLASFRD